MRWFALVFAFACVAELEPSHGRSWPDGAMPTDAPPVHDGGAPDVPPGVDAGTPQHDAGPGVDAGTPPLPDASSPDSGPPDSPPGMDCYWEPVDETADISDLLAGYGGANWKDELIEVFDRRHPATGWLLEAQRDDSYFGTFSDSSNWTRMVEWIDTLSHEETHLFNAYEAIRRGVRHTVYLRSDLMFDLDSWLEGFPRSEIRPMVAIDAIYTDTYFTGSQGARGFIALLDETSCYLNEMAALAVVGEDYPGFGVSSRDGIFAFLYYLELYLRRAREAHPGFYAMIQASPVVKELVQTMWQRTFFFLPISERFPSLGISDGDYLAAAMEPANLNEMRMFLGVDVGASPCVPMD